MSCTTCSFKDNYPSYNSQFDWINDLPDTSDQFDLVEVKFKSTRKEFFRNQDRLPLKRGDKVVVSITPGHDIGEVSLTGYLADKQFKRKVNQPSRYNPGIIYRVATPRDMEGMMHAKSREKELLIKSRQIAGNLGLDMKIGDVEVQADNRKAIFFYIADGRVDFRELIKVYASEFRLKIEMKQIGARQEAGRVGGIGSCGRELCCSSWLTDLKSVPVDALAFQGLSASAQKMAGQCGKLKCCLLYELDAYIEAGREFPQELLVLETAQGTARSFKTDYLSKKIWYSININGAEKTWQLSLEEVRQFIQDNKRGLKPDMETRKVRQDQSEQFVSGESALDNKKNLSRNPRKKKKAGPTRSKQVRFRPSSN
ncbi:MAG: PSP1 domain-containing protein [Bacteroidota bacterium]